MAKKSHKPYTKMNARELAAATKEFDREFVFETFKPLTFAQRQRIKQAVARRKSGRPRVGQGAERINVTVERSLLSRSDAYAKRHGLSRSELIARGLKLLVTAAS